MTELELLKKQYELQNKLQELGQQAGEIQEELNGINAELLKRIKNEEDTTTDIYRIAGSV